MQAAEILESWDGTKENRPANFSYLIDALERDAEANVAHSVELVRADKGDPAHIVEECVAARRGVLDNLRHRSKSAAFFFASETYPAARRCASEAVAAWRRSKENLAYDLAAAA